MTDLLIALGHDPSRDEGLAETPRRVAAYFAEMLGPEPFKLTTFPNEGYDEMVLVRDIPFSSLCAHHLLPFTGVAHVAYIPGDRIVGLSKLARVVDMFARRLQVQEQLTGQVATYLNEVLQPKGVGVVLAGGAQLHVAPGCNKPGHGHRDLGAAGHLP